MLSLVFAGLCFIAIHLGISGGSARDRLVARFGASSYMIGFSIASILSLVWMITAYHDADTVLTWGYPDWWKYVSLILMIPATLLLVIGLATPNPTAVGQESLATRAPTGIVRVTRHPFLIGVAIWALVHLISNGDVASFLFFATLALVAIAGTRSIDAKRRRSLGPAVWDAFAACTSILPFAAIRAGRNTLSLREIGWWRIAAGIIVYALLLGGHVHIIGVSPYPA